MNTKTFFSLLVVAALGVAMVGCDDTKLEVYPTTFYRLSEETLLQKRDDFAKRNPYLTTSLNQFGFCDISESDGAEVASNGSFTKEEAIAAVKDFVARNPEYTGVKNPNDLRFRVIGGDPFFWYFRTENQIINNTEVDYTEILFHIKDGTLISCYGNYFSNVYIPKKFNFDIEKAKSQLLGKEVIHWGWGGPYSAGIITEEHLQQSTAKLIIIPVTTDEKIELRVTWEILLDAPMHYIFDVDVMTGEIIREMPTIIS